MSDEKKSTAGAFESKELEALVEVMFHAAHADGDFGEDERNEFIKNVETLTERRMDHAQVEALATQIAADTAKSGRAARLISVRERLPSERLRLVAVELAIRVIAADGVLRTTERELILEICETLEIDRDKAADLVGKFNR